MTTAFAKGGSHAQDFRYYKEVTNLLASVYDAQMSGIAQFIDGTRELTPDNWAAFQQEMNDLGLSRIEEIQLAAYQAMYGA